MQRYLFTYSECIYLFLFPYSEWITTIFRETTRQRCNQRADSCDEMCCGKQGGADTVGQGWVNAR